MYESNTLSAADVAAVTRNNGNDGMFGNDSWAWIIVLLLLGYGGRGFGGGFGGSGWGGSCGCGCEPCATQSDVRAAVDQQTLISKLDQQTYGLADSTYALNNTINQNFRTVDNAICNLGYNVQNGFNTISHQISDCCCQTQRAIDRVAYENQANTCALQNTIQNTTRDIIDNSNANSRAILDFLVKDKIDTLQSENQSLKLKASQADQNAYLTATIDASRAEIIRRLGADCPQPAYLVNGPTPISFPTNGCGQVQFANSGFGCGCGSF